MLTACGCSRVHNNASHNVTYSASSPAATPGVSGNIPVSWHPPPCLSRPPPVTFLSPKFFCPYRSILSTMATHADLGHGTQQPICQNCTTSTTPLWRRDEIGSVLCNACGLFLKLHGTPRPISLKTDVIKSRNRVKNAAQGQKRKVNSQHLLRNVRFCSLEPNPVSQRRQWPKPPSLRRWHPASRP